MKTNLLRRPFRYINWNTSFILIGINAAVYLLTEMFPRLRTYTSLNVVLVVHGKMYWQFVSYMFTHGSLAHLLGNMLGLLFFGTAVERSIGSKEFLLIYFASGIFCGIASFAVYYISSAYQVFLLGASGVIYAILLFYAVLYPRSHVYIWGILPLPAPLLVIIYALIELGSQFLGVNSGIAHMTHLSGFAFAWLFLVTRMGIHPISVWKNAYRS